MQTPHSMCELDLDIAFAEAWAEGESGLQRAFFQYVMVRFQANREARPCS